MDILLFVGSILTVHILAVMSPGPDFVVAVNNSLLYSRKTGIWTSLGFGLGILVHIFYCVAGLAVIISKSVILFNIIKFFGAAYIFYLGLMSIISKRTKIDVNKEKKAKDISRLKAIKIGFLTNVLNPKATLYFLGIFTIAISPDTKSWVLFTIVLGMFIITVVWFSLVSIFFTQKRILELFSKYQTWFMIILGIILILLSIKVFTMLA
ncbi:MAG: LysE family transporter [Marinifilaceae bacterium]|jgi:RhtB (resistance to homoserine/threonine) family protein|nr:LysE family transporter [Marinifilaceae bacterium]